MFARPAIAYIAQTFPALTQTFVYRETMALEQQGFDIVTCAIWRPAHSQLSQESAHLIARSAYVFPISWPRFLAVHLYFLSLLFLKPFHTCQASLPTHFHFTGLRAAIITTLPFFSQRKSMAFKYHCQCFILHSTLCSPFLFCLTSKQSGYTEPGKYFFG